MENPTSAEMSSASNPANEPSPADTVNTPAATTAPPVQSFPFQSLAPLTIKLDRSNYPYWRSQALPALRAHDLEGYDQKQLLTLLLHHVARPKHNMLLPTPPTPIPPTHWPFISQFTH
ncbi:hypothetical protein F8388_019697 [Cannabis sativa]|uniref:Retrotransposon Copia-like N-terminal domain-containing protein n=1 Tax=Cannabis sativa TaxID=3483 RepID=A0A7J6FGR8_CANSA|nr:hypothetical protein F8388_019697 [Cannabis sativa]